MPPPTLVDLLFDPERCCEFDPFQATRLLELAANDAGPRDAARAWREVEAVVRFRGNLTLAFPPSLVAQILPPKFAPPDTPDAYTRAAAAVRRRYAREDLPVVVGNYFGLFGPNGALPLIYTEKLWELDSNPAHRRSPTRTALRDWLDLFNNRMTAILFRAWQKYRMPVGYLRTAWRQPPGAAAPPLDRVTHVLFSAVGLGTPAHRGRLEIHGPGAAGEGRPLDRIDDRALLRYAGAFARRRPGAHELRAILADYFAVPVRVDAFTGQWLALPPAAQTRLRDGGGARLGVDAVAGEKVWDAGSKFRLRLGPLRYREFVAFLPDPTPVPDRKAVYLLSQLARLYAGAELDFEVQLVLPRHEVPDCVIQDVTEGELGIRLGWNTWLTGEAMPAEVDDVRFDAPCDTSLPGA